MASLWLLSCFTLIGVSVFIHPKFNLRSLYSDIALLKLASPAHFHHSVSPVPLPSDGGFFPSGTRCKIVGLGFLYLNRTVRPMRLQQATVPLLSVATCKHFWSIFSPYAMICAGMEGASNYLGDSGGSLVCRKRRKWSLVGILSFFEENHPTGRPFVVTRVSAFIPWIEEIMSQN
ncbi:PREDICTED: chymotrypsinogen B-like [Condylura cristata]|uniref:chymotrypsinogen B-like n=1 Tax=Condylura cristata TaxID=143302 RepID=UPI0003344618|nr:PREDICTED: chymotrypsinogen B-like [Condylura cristata]